MRLTSTCQTVLSSMSVAGLLTIASPVIAGDLSNGGAGSIKDYASAGVPVPAPMPYQENFKWYVRGDIGTGFKHTGSVPSEGFPVTVTQPSEWKELSIVSFGFGRYVTPSLRTEFTLDYRPDRLIATGAKATADVTRSGQTGTVSDAAGNTATVVSTNIYSGIQNEDVRYQNTTLMMSGLYDFNRGGQLRPYVGAGVGLAVHQLKRVGTDTYTCYTGSQTNYWPGGTTTAGIQGLCTTSASAGLASSYTTTASASGLGYGIAAQLSAGLTYDLTARTHWDTGYRALWQSGHLSVVSSDGLSTLRIKDRTDHEIRTGVRWDLW